MQLSSHIKLQGRPREECGVCGIAAREDAARLACAALYALQHRGQETAGIVAAEGNLHRVCRGAGLVHEVLNEERLAALAGTVAIGHVRYSTCGPAIGSNTQPITAETRFGAVALAHNGNLTNACELRRELSEAGAVFQTQIDSEVILHLLARAEEVEFEQALAAALVRLEGAFSLTILQAGVLYAVRDSRGFRPLVFGTLAGGGWAVASETAALDLLEARDQQEVEPGEIIRFADGTPPHRMQLLPRVEPARCIFEVVYFSRPDSIMGGETVQAARERFGEQLWQEQPARAEIVVAVPDSANAAAAGYARAAGLPLVPGLVRNQYIGRTFIEPHQVVREFRSKLKYNAVREVVEGRRIVVVDDSIVRGTTARRIVQNLRRAGALEVHLRVASPPWRHQCRFGIDTPTSAELLGAARSLEEMRREIGCDSLGFLSTEGLLRASRRGEGWCSACFTGRYPGVGRAGVPALAGFG